MYHSAGIPRRFLVSMALVALTAGPVFGQAAFRGFWADAFHIGFKSTAQIDTMVARAKQGNYNAIIAEVLAYQDRGSGGHGAYWNSAILPKAADITGGIDPLAYLCQKAHAEGIEVHAWLVTYRVSTVWPPPNNPLLAAHPEWFMVSLANMGEGPAKVGNVYVLDPGCPEVQEHLMSIVRELVTNYPIDGINWDYVRYTQVDAGYPADASYENSGLARFRRITGFVGTPATNNTSWSNFRRRTIDELVRRCRAEIAAIDNPRQPLRHTADLVCFGNPPANFNNSDAYLLHQNWRHWMEMGWLDAAIPMNYKDDRTHFNQYRAWINAALGWRYNRHLFCGQGNYLNSKANSLAQLQYIYAQGADGSVNYSYASTADENDDGVEEADFSFYPYVAEHIFTSPVPTPPMPWRDPATATEGTLWGRVTENEDGKPIDDATVQVGALPPVQTDGNGYYVVTLIPAIASGTSYNVTATKAGYPQAAVGSVQVFAGGLSRRDIVLGAPNPPVINQVTPDPAPALVGEPYTVQLTLLGGTADNWTIMQGPPGASVTGSGFVSWTPLPENDGQLITFTVRATNSVGFHEETWQVSVSTPPPCENQLLTDFEGYNNNVEVLLQEPSYSGSTNTQIVLNVPDLNVRGVTNEVQAFSGAKCYKLRWQFLDGTPGRWLRATTGGVTNLPNPIVSLQKPIRVRLRLETGGPLLVSIGLRETGSEGSFGSNGGTTGTIEWVGANGRVGGLGPQGKLLAAAPGVWQTLVFDPQRDPITGHTGDGQLATPNGMGTLEQIAFTSTGNAGPVTVYIDTIEQLCHRPATSPVDFDEDGDVDAADFAVFAACRSGPAIPQLDPACAAARLDDDDDVDLDDFGLFQRCVTGLNIPSDPACPM